LSHNIDLGIVRTPFDTSKVNTFYLEKEPMIVIGKKEYFKRPISKMKDLKKIPLIIHQRYLPLINDYSLNKHIQIQIKVTCDDSRTSLIWANSGIGVAIVPLSSLSLNYDSSLEYAYLEDKDLYTGIAFITRKNEETPILINQFIECFK
jgi:DNA-binding transcriptional LysR family regulator